MMLDEQLSEYCALAAEVLCVMKESCCWVRENMPQVVRDGDVSQCWQVTRLVLGEYKHACQALDRRKGCLSEKPCTWEGGKGH